LQIDLLNLHSFLFQIFEKKHKMSIKILPQLPLTAAPATLMFFSVYGTFH
jgi:hypothetical protein